MKKVVLLLVGLPGVLFGVVLRDDILLLNKKINQSFTHSYIGRKVYDSPKGISLWTLNGNLQFCTVDSAKGYENIMWGGGNSVSAYHTLRLDNYFITPWAMTHSKKKVYITDIDKHKIHILKREGDKLMGERMFGTRGSGSMQFIRPSGIAVRETDKGDLFYVVEAGNNRIQAYRGTCLIFLTNCDEKFGINYMTLNNTEPMGVAIIVNDTNDFKSDEIIVCDTAGQVSQYAFTRDWVDHFGKTIKLLKFEKQLNLRTIASNASLYGIAVDKYKHIYVIDQANTMLHILDKELTYLFSYNLAGDGIWTPWYVDVLKDYGLLTLTWGGGADGGGLAYWINNAVFAVQTEHAYFSPESTTHDSVTVNYRLFVPSLVTVTVYDSAGQQVNVIVNQEYQDTEFDDRFQTVWNRKDVYGRNAAPGAYRIKIKAKGYYGTCSEIEETVDVYVEEH